MRQLAQKILDEQQKQIAEVKEWQVRSRQADYKAQPDQPPPGSGLLDQKGAQTARQHLRLLLPAQAAPRRTCPWSRAPWRRSTRPAARSP